MLIIIMIIKKIRRRILISDTNKCVIKKKFFGVSNCTVFIPEKTQHA